MSITHIKPVKAASRDLTTLTPTKINHVLRALASELTRQASWLLRENKKDLERMDVKNPLYPRLILTTEKIKGIARGIQKVARLPSPLGITLETRQRPNGLLLKKISVPLGVVGVIFESRPNVLIDVFTLCLKSGNACVLKGGSDATHSNQALFQIITTVLNQEKINPGIIHPLPPGHAAVADMLRATGIIDVIIPRGSKSLIDYVRQNSRVPVIETGAGVVHLYVDASANPTMAGKLLSNSKISRPSACNALDTVIIHQAQLKNLATMAVALGKANVEIYADKPSFRALAGTYPKHLLKPARPTHFGTEFLSLKLAIKTVSEINEALDHIAKHGSGHTEVIVSENKKHIKQFLHTVDAAAVYANAATVFTDGGEYGLGAEIGISTQKLHARGPMGLHELTSYKWIGYGTGQVRK